jgi:hypothetical protein
MDANLRAYGYNNELQRHRDNARRALEHAKQHLDYLLANFDNEPPSSLLANSARQLNASAAEFGAEAQALLTLHEVRFLVVDENPES